MPSANGINFKVNVSYGDSSLSDQNSTETKLIMFILWGIILPLVVIAGLVGNILTIIVLWRREMHSTTILYLRGLVITDTGILIGSVLTLTPLSCSNYLHGEALDYFRDVVYPIIHTPGYYIMMTLQQCNVWITVSVSMERYIAICHPFRAARLVTRRKTIIVLVAVVIISFIYNVPHLFATTTNPCSGMHPPTQPRESRTPVGIESDSSHGYKATFTRTLPVPTTLPPVSPPLQCLELATTEFGRTEFYMIYRTILYSIIIYIIPFLALLVLNIFLIKELMVMQRRRSGTNIHDENEANLSLVLVLIVIVFIFCQTPGLVSQFDLIRVDIFVYWLTFSNLLFTVNSAVNFLIYTAFGRKFRRVLLRVFRHLVKKNRHRSQSSFRMTQYTDADLDTCEQTETHCTPLRGVSCYGKDCKTDDESNESIPLKTAAHTSDKVNGQVRRANYNEGGLLSPTAKNNGDVNAADVCESIDALDNLLPDKHALGECGNDVSTQSQSISGDVTAGVLSDETLMRSKLGE